MRRIFLTVLTFTATASQASPVQVWRQETATDFSAGKLQRAIVTSDGQVALSRQLRPLAELKAEQLWAAAVAPGGDLYLATGSPGSIVRIDSEGMSTVLHQDDTKQFFALCVGPDGSVYAAASPGGRILKIKPEGGVEEYYPTGETYVWALATDAAGNLYAATGENGKLFRIGPDRRGSILFKAKQPHLLCLAIEPSGRLHVGSSKDGIVYRLEADGKAFVVHDAAQADVQTILVGDEGVVFAGTGSPARPSFPSSGMPRSSGELGPGIDLRSVSPGVSASKTDAPAGRVRTASGDSHSDASSNSSSSSGTSTSSSSAQAGENSVYRIQPDGVVDEIFRAKALVLSLAMQAGKLLVGTGKEGRLFEVDPKSGVHGELARLEQGQVTALAVRPDGSVVVGAGGRAAAYQLDDRLAAAGTLFSSVLDAKLPARWGRAQSRSEAPVGTSIELAFRAGNIADPDETWSNWADDPSQLPVARFLQYRVSLASPAGKNSPTFQQLAVYYATVNQPPKLEKIEVPDIQKSPVVNAGSKLTIKWKATDPNNDPLEYRLELRKEGWPEWVTLAKDLSKSEYEWDPGSLPGGSYKVRVVASDAAGNPDGQALVAAKTSEEFALDRESPTVQILSSEIKERRAEVKVLARDGESRLVSAGYSIDGKAWTPLFPDDGIFDQREEQATFRTPELSEGGHVVLVRFQDAGGQVGVADAVVSVPAGP